MSKNINWAILGTGVVANEMAAALRNAGKSVYAVGNRTYEKAVAFAEKYQISKVYQDFHEMFHDENVDVIYITTPHNTHIKFMLEAMAQGKHILCEKAITLNSQELEQAIALAEEKQVVSLVKSAPTGVDEMSGIVMTNEEGQMVVISLSLHTKQPKRCVICAEKGYVEITDYPRAEEAKIIYTESGKTEIIREGEMSRALQYEMEDMEQAIRGSQEIMLLAYTRDVMELMTQIRKDWNLVYPEEKDYLKA